jgi:hypothetical protein
MTPEDARCSPNRGPPTLRPSGKRGRRSGPISSWPACVAWCEREGLVVGLSPQPVEKFMAALFESGNEASSVLARRRGVRRFSAWLAADLVARASIRKRTWNYRSYGEMPQRIRRLLGGYEVQSA